MDYKFIKVLKKEKTIDLIFNRPDSLNALSIPMLKEIMSALAEIASAKQDILLLKGNGRAFCVGADINERKQGLSLETYLMERVLTLQRIANLLRNMEKVIISVMHGHVIGAGLVMALYADIKIAADNTVFRLPEIEVDSTILCGGYKVLMESVGVSKAMELLLLGEPFGVDDAEKFGLIQKKVPLEKLKETEAQYVDKLAAKSSSTRRLVKKAAVSALEDGFDQMLLREAIDAAINHYTIMQQGR